MAVGLCAEALAADPSNHCDLRVLVHPQQHHRRRAQHLNDMLGLSDRVIQDPRIASPWSILAGCDAALAIGPSGGGPSLAWAMAAGLPIVGEARRPITDRAPDGETAMLVEPGKPRLMADRLRHCFTERYGPQSITERAARRAREKFTPQAFCKVMLGVYGCD
jgi:glycosyltransferase involved in cell wall biosynthesis